MVTPAQEGRRFDGGGNISDHWAVSDGAITWTTFSKVSPYLFSGLPITAPSKTVRSLGRPF